MLPAMHPRRALTLSLASLLAGLAGTVRAEALPWVSAEIPPYLWQGSRGPEGYAFELFRRVLRQAGLTGELHFYPWARALRMLQSRQAQAVVAMARTPEREPQFRWLFPIGAFRFAVVTRAAEGPVSSDLEALRSRRVASLRASASRSMLEVAGIPQVVEGKDYPELLALLRRDVVDVVIGPDTVLRSLGGPGLRVTRLAHSHELCAAAGAAMTDGAVQRLRTAYQQLVDDGSVAQLRKRYPALFPDD